MTIHSAALAVHVLISITIIALVLLQRGKGAEAGAAFGAGASGTVFGAKGSANFLTRMTAVLAAMFFMSSLGLAYLGGNRPVVDSLMEDGAPAGVEVTGTRPLGEGEAPVGELPDLPGMEVEVEEEILEPGPAEE
jgi:preprotein translocase subunit SecG